MPPLNPTREIIDAHGYKYVETSDEWKQACSIFPCFKTLEWPDYATRIIEDQIDGQPVVIQLWKGWCEQFLGMPRMPGGVGAEVGIYRKVPGRAFPPAAPGLPDGMLDQLKNRVGHIGDDHLWWPWPEIGATLTFELVNPRTGDTFFAAGPEKTYWLAKWMSLSSYKRYVHAQPRRGLFRRQVPDAWDYQLKFTINGRRYPVWDGHAG